MGVVDPQERKFLKEKLTLDGIANPFAIRGNRAIPQQFPLKSVGKGQQIFKSLFKSL